ncbi:hypothetical protein glysoja_046021 [Glycine soja]|uniref:DNA helicase Pif1-like 2B domain-containing protein n=1 Tax=Glycine soja TaxID=3848 RepID=A0A0B2RRR6_GLYSO|nr:hypothetical protein glysoja_046021 [Glycine soja]
MLLRNIDQSFGLCHDTGLVVTQLVNHVLEAKVISSINIGEKIFIPSLSLTPFDHRISFQFQYKQFPMVISFVMKINKSQG